MQENSGFPGVHANNVYQSGEFRKIDPAGTMRSMSGPFGDGLDQAASAQTLVTGAEMRVRNQDGS